MLQRIQTVYLLVVTVLLIITMCQPVGSFVAGDGSIYNFMSYGIVFPDGATSSSSWGMLALLILSAIVSSGTIFMFKNRILQIRMTVFNSIILIGYYITFVVFMFVLKGKLEASYQLSWALALPLVCIILNYLAIRAIGKDEFMVKAADRLRP